VLWLLFTGATLLLWPAARPAQLLDLNELQLWMLAFCGANTLVAYGAFGEALRHWEISRVSAILATAPLFTIISMWLIGWSGWNLVAPEGLNTASVLGALVVITGSMICALAARPAP
jgi:drug/metabolite transporter (DMT)-like permease